MRSFDLGPWICIGATSTSPQRHVEVGIGVLEAAREQQHVGRGQREPEGVLLHPRHDRVVDDAAVAVADEHVLGLTNGALGQVPWRQQLGELEAVRPGHLQAALDRHVPYRDVVEERLELRFEGIEADREQHVVVDREARPGCSSCVAS